MPCTNEAIIVLQKGGVLYTPGKASNAGGVAVLLGTTQKRKCKKGES